ncbi:hypothetical protein P872_02145 [Rhodonellum psychrophilum GCM71 = DSM 17998]|uniref:Uncharacterized protein n=1 Tax=Rhodonellum psychrophilum GCM71 = DSM 17998 TaxID=1123057 RepID=U5C4M1_9BACT|nr:MULTISPECIES: hypothetical protein [Rhodonellum]ERM83841.1 hypothetical protein P872_02145 [Rhodonellum psychrophilum GCM71 = DSM 17998]MDO9554382.1 hypothetical protein [Rhodonellum sp.]
MHILNRWGKQMQDLVIMKTKLMEKIASIRFSSPFYRRMNFGRIGRKTQKYNFKK